MKPIMKSIEELAEANQIDLSGARADEVYRTGQLCIYQILHAIVSNHDEDKRPTIAMLPTAIGISNDFVWNSVRILRSVGMIVNGKHLDGDEYWAYFINIKQPETAGEYRGLDLARIISPFVFGSYRLVNGELSPLP
ncbi:MAG TPA: hypothetical protein VJA18_00915 [Candidatus Nanoarchaeia archaeon]|nr:hypothetical protein [Candidatus Nanoarchaeia archaeon]